MQDPGSNWSRYGSHAQSGFINLEEALNVCERSCFPLIYAQDLLVLYHSLKHRPKSWDDQRALLALCFYEVAKSEGTPRSLKEVSKAQHIPLMTLMKLAKIHFPESSPIDPVSLLNRLGAEVGLTRRQCKELENEAEELKLHFHQPTTVAAALLHHFVKQRSLDISLDLISKVCLTSPVAVRRFSSKMFLASSKDEPSFNWFQQKSLEGKGKEDASPPQDMEECEEPSKTKEGAPAKKAKKRKAKLDTSPILGPPPKLQPREKWLS